MESALEFYSSLWEIRDKRLDNWFMMSSPWPTLALSLAYVYSVTILGPKFMKDREAFTGLKWPIQIYNIFQVGISAYIVYEACAAGWLTTYSWGKMRGPIIIL